jgi:hypothetical protein
MRRNAEPEPFQISGLSLIEPPRVFFGGFIE